MNASNPERMNNFEAVSDQSVEELKKQGWTFNGDETWGVKLEVKDSKSGDRIIVIKDTYGNAPVSKGMAFSPTINIDERPSGIEDFSLERMPDDHELNKMVMEAVTWNAQGKPEEIYAAISNTEESDPVLDRYIESRTTEQLFEDNLENRMESVPVAHIQVSDKLAKHGITGMFITPYQDNSSDQTKRYVNVIMQREKSNLTFRINEQGQIATPWNRNESLDQATAIREVLISLEKVGTSFWLKIDDSLLPNQDPRKDDEDEDDENLGKELYGQKREKNEGVNPDRLAILTHHKRVLFGAVNEEEGLDGYHICIFKKCFVLENSTIGNAAFVYTFPEQVKINDDVFDLSPNNRTSSREQEMIYEEYVRSVVANAKTKKQLMAMGAERIIHKTEETGAAKILAKLEEIGV